MTGKNILARVVKVVDGIKVIAEPLLLKNQNIQKSFTTEVIDKNATLIPETFLPMLAWKNFKKWMYEKLARWLMIIKVENLSNILAAEILDFTKSIPNHQIIIMPVTTETDLLNGMQIRLTAPTTLLPHFSHHYLHVKAVVLICEIFATCILIDIRKGKATTVTLNVNEEINQNPFNVSVVEF